MIDSKPKVLREIPVGTRIHDPVLMLNQTSSEIHTYISRDLADTKAPRRVQIGPSEYFDFPHMNYNLYADHVHSAPGETEPKCHVVMLKGKTREAFLKRVPRGMKEAKTFGECDS